MSKIEGWQLAQRQSLPLEAKVRLSEKRIEQWYGHWQGMVYVSFSGGKDSTVLLDIVRRMYPHIPAVFVNTGLEFPEILSFVKSIDNVVWLRPKMTFRAVLEKYGYPIISKDQATAISRYRNTKDPEQKYRRMHGWPRGKKGMISKKWQHLVDAPFKISAECCGVMKKSPFKRYVKESGRHPMNGVMASDSYWRKGQYLATGCNAFDSNDPISKPLSVWTEEDVWDYIKSRKLPYSPIYDMGYCRTGCVFCMFGLQKERSPNRFQRMKQTHPKLWKYCMVKLGLKKVLNYMGIPGGK